MLQTAIEFILGELRAPGHNLEETAPHKKAEILIDFATATSAAVLNSLEIHKGIAPGPEWDNNLIAQPLVSAKDIYPGAFAGLLLNTPQILGHKPLGYAVLFGERVAIRNLAGDVSELELMSYEQAGLFVMYWLKIIILQTKKPA